MKKLTKQQQQIAVLVAIVCGGLVYVLFRFGLAPMKEQGAERKNELVEAEQKLETAKRVILREQQQREEINRITGEIRKVTALHIPPVDNTLSWATGRLYEIARRVQVEIEWVERVEKVFPMPAKMQNEPENFKHPMFQPYVVRVLTVCSYAKCMELIGELEASNPYLCISEVSVVGQKSDLHNHRFTFVAEWPMWTDYEKAMITLDFKTEAENETETDNG